MMESLRIVPEVLSRYKPEAVVLQCGADGLSCDPIGVFNLTSESFCHATRFVLCQNLPTLLLGGGGYNKANVARCWTLVTATVLDIHLNDDILEHDLFMLYKPGYSISINSGKRPNSNTEETLNSVVGNVLNVLSNIQQTPDIL